MLLHRRSAALVVAPRHRRTAPFTPSDRKRSSPKLVESLENRLLFASDFGDAPASYGTLLANNGPSHVLGSGLFLGAAVDTEADGLPSANADGDDNSGGTPDDEDGVTLAPLVAGEQATATVVVHLQGGVSSARLSAWVDWNGNGSFLDDATAASAVVVTNGSNNVVINVPAGATPGQTYARFRLSSVASLGPQGAGPDGEVEDYLVTINPGTDFGDAPNGYGTLAANSGASHTRVAGLYLGAGVDGETDGQPSANADGDDANGTDDEDGVTFSSLVNNSNASATVVAHIPGGTSARLSAWIDFNGNGTFNDDLAIANGVVVANGNNTLNFFIPSNAVSGTTYARFRLSPMTTASPVGAATGGEVEDYLIQIAPVAWVAPGSQATWNATSHTLTVTGDATIIGDPGPSLNAVINVTGGAAALHVTPGGGAGGVINLSTVNVTGGGSMNVSPRSVTGGLTTIVIRPPAGSSAGGPPNVDGTSTFDLADNAMVLKSAAAALSTLQTSIRTGYNAGAWNGLGGVTSSSAATDPTHSTALGFASNGVLNKTSFAGVTGLGATDVLVKYTYAGDASLDGQVDIGDLGLLSGAWQQLTGKTWFDGDFTYDGAVNIGDLGLLAGNWQKGVGNPI